MIARAFRPVAWVAGIGAAALVCYMLSLQVASERAELANLERQILNTRQQIRSLHTELGTRGRLQQLETWNAEVLALSAPVAAQFLDSNVSLARFDVPDAEMEAEAPVRMASTETSTTAPAARAIVPTRTTPAPSAPQVRLASATAAPRAVVGNATSATPRRASLTVAPPSDKPAAVPAPTRSRSAATSETRGTQAQAPAPASGVSAPRATRSAAATNERRSASTTARPTRTASSAREGALLDDRTVRALGTEARSERQRARD